MEDYKVLVDNYPMATHFIDFTATPQPGGSVKLEWTASDEAGTSEYIVERSTDNRDWSQIGQVEAKGASGANSYFYFDKTDLKGYIYYRVRAVQPSGANKLSEVRRVEMKDDTPLFRLQPNPARDHVELRFDLARSESVELTLMSPQGAVLLKTNLQGRAGSNTATLVLPAGIQSGLYFLRLQHNGSLAQQKLMIIH